MPLDVACPNCGLSATHADARRGMTVPCARCAYPVRVEPRRPPPSSMAPAPAPAPAPALGPARTRSPFEDDDTDEFILADTVVDAPRVTRSPVPVPPPLAPRTHPTGQTARRRHGRTSSAHLALGPRPVNFVYLAGAALLLGGFFLPWIDFFIVSLSGFNIPRVVNGMLDVAGRFAEEAEIPLPIRIKCFSLYLLYLIPLAAGGGILVELTTYQQGRDNVPLKIASAVSPLVAAVLILLVFASDVDLRPDRPAPDVGHVETPSVPDGSAPSGPSSGGLLNVLGPGFYATFLGMVLAFVGTLAPPGGAVSTRRRRHSRRGRH